MITAEEFLSNTNEDELFCIVGEYLFRLNEERLFYIDDDEIRILDRDKIKICRDMIKTIKGSRWLEKMKFKDLFEYLEKKCAFRESKEKGFTWNCDGKLTFTKEFCDKNGIEFQKIEKILNETGGYCDCEVLFNSKEGIDKNTEME